MKSCLLCGVGGQGTVLASRIIATASMEKGLFARTAETIGMAQRGGSVVSHVRIGKNVSSPMIPDGKADVIIAFEPGEAVRNLHYLKKDGIVIVCDKELRPVTDSLGDSQYNGKEMTNYIKKNVKKTYILDADDVCEKCGTPKALNVALTGAMAITGVMGLTMDDIEKAVELKVKPQFVDMNKRALRIGADSIQEKTL